jgi:hypothetical protein
MFLYGPCSWQTGWCRMQPSQGRGHPTFCPLHRLYTQQQQRQGAVQGAPLHHVNLSLSAPCWKGHQVVQGQVVVARQRWASHLGSHPWRMLAPRKCGCPCSKVVTQLQVVVVRRYSVCPAVEPAY